MNAARCGCPKSPSWGSFLREAACAPEDSAKAVLSGTGGSTEPRRVRDGVSTARAAASARHQLERHLLREAAKNPNVQRE